MAIKTARWDEKAQPSGGLRVLVTRFRPRGVRKEDETWDRWMPQVAPSPETLKAFRAQEIGWGEFRKRYLREMKSQQEKLHELQSLGKITLLCSSTCFDERRCHRSLLKGLLERAVHR